MSFSTRKKTGFKFITANCKTPLNKLNIAESHYKLIMAQSSLLSNQVGWVLNGKVKLSSGQTLVLVTSSPKFED